MFYKRHHEDKMKSTASKISKPLAEVAVKCKIKEVIITILLAN